MEKMEMKQNEQQVSAGRKRFFDMTVNWLILAGMLGALFVWMRFYGGWSVPYFSESWWETMVALGVICAVGGGFLWQITKYTGICREEIGMVVLIQVLGIVLLMNMFAFEPKMTLSVLARYMLMGAAYVIVMAVVKFHISKVSSSEEEMLVKL